MQRQHTRVGQGGSDVGPGWVCRPADKPQLLEATLVGLQALHSTYGSDSTQVPHLPALGLHMCCSSQAGSPWNDLAC